MAANPCILKDDGYIAIGKNHSFIRDNDPVDYSVVLRGGYTFNPNWALNANLFANNNFFAKNRSERHGCITLCETKRGLTENSGANGQRQNKTPRNTLEDIVAVTI